MYGLMGKMLAAPGKREELLAIMLEDNDNAMAGCLSYIVARDPENADAIWTTEVWDSKENHLASLNLPHVQATIARAHPLIAGFGERFETEPVGGIGL
jgi:quinol monooxygenase YgiN